MYPFRICTAALVALLPLVSSVAVDLEKRASDVEVTLSSAGGSLVKATVKNNAAQTFKFLKAGTFLDPAPVEKATVFKGGARRAFKGVLFRPKLADLTEDAFATLAPGATLENTFDLAPVTDLSAGGAFEIVTEGAVPLASGTDLSGDKLVFRSNKLSIDVDGAAAARVAPAVNLVDKPSGSAAKFQEYFKTTATDARTIVADRFRGVAAQAGTTTNGSTRYFCTDPYGYCNPK
ncbi:MAG: hypothetical protein Q9208_003984 [Pyrenodesmia sp. 3 TL-2023]